jgi:hypothetical protein
MLRMVGRMGVVGIRVMAMGFLGGSCRGYRERALVGLN